MIMENTSNPVKTEFSTKTAAPKSLGNLTGTLQLDIRANNQYKAAQSSHSCRIVELAGCINNKGLAEIPLDATVRDVIYGIGGGVSKGKKLKAVLLGGVSGVFLNRSYLDLTLDNDSLKGTGLAGRFDKIEVMDDCTCMVDAARLSMITVIQKLCGKCIPCREGTKRMVEILERISTGGGLEEDIDVLQDLVDTIANTSLCKLGKISVNPVESTLRHFKNEYIAHAVHRKCPSGVCEMSEGSRKNGVFRIKDGAFECCSNIA